MAQRHNHYEAAFEDFVRSRGWPYLPVDEQKKAIFAGARIKSFDFLVYRPGTMAWLADVKGRKFPYETANGRRYWENWVTREDLDGLKHWEDVFGAGFGPVFVFVYWLTEAGERDPSSALHVFRDRTYALFWIPTADYAAHARRRSPKWDTVDVPVATFRKLIKPLDGV